MKLQLWHVTLLAFVTLAPNVSAAPDTPPTLAWETAISISPLTCPAVNSEDRPYHGLTTDQAGAIYVVYRCFQVAANAFKPVIIKYGSNGGKLWQVEAPCVTTCSASIGLIADSAGKLLYTWCDTAAVTGKRFVFINQATGVLELSNGGDFFATTFCGDGGTEMHHTVDYRVLNSTSIQYIVGDSAGHWSIVCHWNVPTCINHFEVSSTTRGTLALSSGMPYAARAYGNDPSDGLGNQNTYRINLTNGGADAESLQTPCRQGIPWLHHGAALLYLVRVKGCTDFTTLRPTFTEYNATTLAILRDDITFIEPNVTGFNGFKNAHASGYLDGAGSMFQCGRVFPTDGITITGEQQSTILKFNTTATPGQRWNITFNKRNPDAGGREQIAQCILDYSGNLIVLGQSCNAGFTDCTGYLRKYPAAGIPRNVQSTITITAATSPSNALEQIIFYPSQQWGFDWGPIFGAIVIGVITVGVAKKTNVVLAVAIAAILATILVVKLEPFHVEDWLLFIIVFLIIAVAGGKLTDSGEDES